MITPRFLLLAALAAPLAAGTARAQVTIDLKALDQMRSGTPAPAPAPAPASAPAARATSPKKPDAAASEPKKPTRREAAEQRKKEAAERKKAASKSTQTPPSGSAATAPATAAPAAPAPRPLPPPAAVLPSAVPPQVRLSPIQPEPSAPPPVKPSAKPDAPVVAEGAGGGPTPIDGGVRITFDGGGSTLSPASETGIKTLAARAPKSDDVTYNVLGFASGTPEDPSTPRRLSLSRALAVRSVLMAQGVPSTHIYVRALGPAPSGAPPDRVDVTIAGGNAQ